MTDLGKPTIDLLKATRAIIERDIGQGFITPERLRFTIEARKETVKKLAGAGMSQRQIAKTVGVSAGQVNADLKLVQKSNEKRSRIEHQNVDASVEDDAQTIWRRGLMNRAIEATSHAAFDDWSSFTVDAELVESVSQAASAWNSLTNYLRELTNEPHN